MKTIAYLIIADLFISGATLAQTTITLQPTPSQGKDAEIFSCVPCGYVNNNYGTKKDFNAFAWTNAGNLTMVRSLMQFDLTSIPANALITSATLSLYFNTTSAEGTHSGVNASYLQKIMAPWGESTVTWNNQPATSTINQVLLPTSTTTTQDYLNINITNFVRDMVAYPATNYGFMIKLANESVYRKMIFASSDHLTPAMRPKLVVTYTTPLPVSLLSFSVKNKGETNELTWSTASEVNNAGFEIERSHSTDIHFENIGQVNGHGNSSQINNYEFIDKNILSGTTYLYRLKQIDFDGRYVYSTIIKSAPCISASQVSAGPNPFHETSTIYYTLDETSEVKIDAYDIEGRKIMVLEDEYMSKGHHEIIFDPKSNGYSAGVYTIRISINGNTLLRRLICTP